MKNTKGFTLVELLAVIVILAIIAIVTTPVILNVIDEARKSGAEDKAWGTIKSVQLAFARAQTDPNNTLNTSGTQRVDFERDTPAIGGTTITMNGDKPIMGTVTINLDTGAITCENLIFVKSGVFACSTNDSGTEMECRRTTIES